MTLHPAPKRDAPRTGTLTAVGNSEAGAQESLAELLRQPAFQEVASLFRQFIAAAGNGRGAPGIARVLQQHTGKPGRRREPVWSDIAASGAEQWSRASDGSRPVRPLPKDAAHAVAVFFDVDRWVAVACPRGEVSAAISLLDSGDQPTGVDLSSSSRRRRFSVGNCSTVAASPRSKWPSGRLCHRALGGLRHRPGAISCRQARYDLDQPHRAVLVLPTAVSRRTCGTRWTERSRDSGSRSSRQLVQVASS